MIYVLIVFLGSTIAAAALGAALSFIFKAPNAAPHHSCALPPSWYGSLRRIA